MPIFWWLANSWQHKIAYRFSKVQELASFLIYTRNCTFSVCDIIATNRFSLAMSTSFNNLESCDYTNINLVNSFVLNRICWSITFEAGQLFGDTLESAPSAESAKFAPRNSSLGKSYLIANYDGQFFFSVKTSTPS